MGSIAPLVSGPKPLHWRFLPSPGVPAGIVPNQGPSGPIGLTVELYLGSLGWTDISPFVLYRDSSVLVTITRGRPNETSSIQPQTASFQVNNCDGRFSPRNPTGPYFGNIGRNTQVRISRLQNGVRRYRFCGEVTSWPVTWDISGNDVYVQVTAAGMLRRLGQGSNPIGSALRRAIPKLPSLIAYWPCEDGSTATQLNSAIAPIAPIALGSSATPAAFSGFIASNPIPTFQSGSWAAAVPAYQDTGQIQIRFLCYIPASTLADQTRLLSVNTTGSVTRVDLLYVAGGGLHLLVYNDTTVLADDTVNFNQIDGQTMLMALQWNVTGGNTKFDYGYTIAGTSGATMVGPTVTGSAPTGITRITVAPDGTMKGASAGHLFFQTVYGGLFGIFDLRAPGGAWVIAASTIAFGDSPQARFTRLCTEQGINGVIVSPGELGTDAVVMGAQPSDTFSNLIQQVPTTGLGLLYEARDQLALAYRTRLSLYNQGTSYNPQRGLTLDFAQNQLSGPLNPLDDDANTLNDVTAQRINGSTAQAVLTAGALSTQPPPNGVGSYATQPGISLNADWNLADQAYWRLHMGTVDEPRYPQLMLNLRHPQFTGNIDLMNQAMVLDIGDLVAVNNPPAWMPPDQIRQILQGYSETLGIFEHDMILNCSPESPYRIAVGDDPVLCRADTDGSTIVADNGGTLSVASTNTLLPLWTTSGGDFPFDVWVGGERITVTNITGASSPQTFTVTRSVNGVVKTQLPGTDVRLYQPMIPSL